MFIRSDNSGDKIKNPPEKFKAKYMNFVIPNLRTSINQYRRKEVLKFKWPVQSYSITKNKIYLIIFAHNDGGGWFAPYLESFKKLSGNEKWILV